MKRAALYLRVSTVAQATRDREPEGKLDPCPARGLPGEGGGA
jgi:hypothetical protein